jgi:hypothetical protein
MRGRDKLNSREMLNQVSPDFSLPVWVKVQFDLVDEPVLMANPLRASA